MPKDVGIIDLMLGIPSPNQPATYDFMRPLFRDKQSREQFEFPVEYMFKDVPKTGRQQDYIKYTLEKMDQFGIERALIGVSVESETSKRALKQHPDRFIPSGNCDPNKGMEGVRQIVREYEAFGIKAIGAFPCGYVPQVPINDKAFYPIYAKCVELDIAFASTMGVPGPRIPFSPQDVARLDEICWYFPELRFVTRHGCEPWTDLAVKLMLKWPNLYYSTTAFAPKYYPEDVVHFANTRGADKVIWSGYFPAGLTYDRIFAELPDVPFRDHVWPKFLHENATRVFKLGT
jgi:hypothetical protein